MNRHEKSPPVELTLNGRRAKQATTIILFRASRLSQHGLKTQQNHTFSSVACLPAMSLGGQRGVT